MPKTFEVWAKENCVNLRAGYKREKRAKTTKSSFGDWCADVYAVYVEGFYSKAKAAA